MPFARVEPPVRSQLDRYGLSDLVGKDAFFETVEDAVTAFEAWSRTREGS